MSDAFLCSSQDQNVLAIKQQNRLIGHLSDLAAAEGLLPDEMLALVKSTMDQAIALRVSLHQLNTHIYCARLGKPVPADIEYVKVGHWSEELPQEDR